MKLEIPVKADFDDIQDMIDEIKRLQTYKLFEGDDMVLVDLDAVVAVMANHVKADKCSESQNSWIPVSKELPKEPCKTQVTTEWAKNDRTTEYAYYQGGEDKWGILTSHVVAWAKLLDPFQPKGDE